LLSIFNFESILLQGIDIRFEEGQREVVNADNASPAASPPLYKPLDTMCREIRLLIPHPGIACDPIIYYHARDSV
jgi:hypothetical protein